MRPDNEVNMAVSRMKSGKHPLEALNRLTNNMSLSLKHSVCIIVFFASCLYVSNFLKEENNMAMHSFYYTLYFSCFSWSVSLRCVQIVFKENMCL
jgi:hypothetical protein